MSTLRMLTLPAHARMLLSWDVTSDSDLRKIRAGIDQFFRAGLSATDGEVGPQVALVATELAGNALRHGAPPISVRLLRDDDCYFLDVSDGNLGGMPAIIDTERPVRAGGRGLLIAAALAEQVCWYVDETAKHIWASFADRPA